jgi:hypothetical protein
MTPQEENVLNAARNLVGARALLARHGPGLADERQRQLDEAEEWLSEAVGAL